MATATLRQIPAFIALREPFKGSSMSAEVHPRYVNSGILNADERAQLDADRDSIVYVVYSYATPIAWVRADGTAYRVAQRFSVTTSKHQSRLYTLTGV